MTRGIVLQTKTHVTVVAKALVGKLSAPFMVERQWLICEKQPEQGDEIQNQPKLLAALMKKQDALSVGNKIGHVITLSEAEWKEVGMPPGLAVHTYIKSSDQYYQIPPFQLPEALSRDLVKDPSDGVCARVCHQVIITGAEYCHVHVICLVFV